MDSSRRTILRGEVLALHVQDERIAHTGAHSNFFGLHPDPPILAPFFVPDEGFVEGGVAGAHDFAQQAFNSTQEIRLSSVFHVFCRQIFLVIDV